MNLGSRYYLPDSAHPIRLEDDYVPKEEDCVIPFDKIRSIRVTRAGLLRIRARHGGLFSVQAPATIDDVAAYLAGLPAEVKRHCAPRLSEAATKTFHTVSFALSLVSVLCAGAWMLLDVPNKLFALLNVSILAIAFVLFCLFFKVIASAGIYENGHSGTLGWFAALFPLIYHYTRDYNYPSYAQFVLPASVLAGCALLLFLTLNARNEPGEWLTLVFIGVVMISPLIVGNLNVLLDDGAVAKEQTAVAWNKPFHGNGTDDNPYELMLGKPIQRQLNVSRAVYEAVAQGDEVNVTTRTGTFGIDYMVVELPAQ